MASDNFTITVKGASGAGGGEGNTLRLDISALQKAVNDAASALKKLETTQFQKNMESLGSSLRAASHAALSYTSTMAKAEAGLHKALESMHKRESAQKTTSSGNNAINPTGLNKSTKNENTQSANIIKSVSSLRESIDKLNSSLVDSFKNTNKKMDKNPEAKELKEKESSQGMKESIDNLSIAVKGQYKFTPETKEALSKAEVKSESSSKVTDDVKKVLAAVGVGALVRQITELGTVAPARTAGMLIGSNVISNPQQAGAEAIQAQQSRQVSETKLGGGGIGGIIGGLLGSVIPGIGTLIGGGLGAGIGAGVAGLGAETKTATETPTLIRGLQSNFYSNLGQQQKPFGAFANSQYGEKGFGSSAAFQDPFLESRAALGRGYSKFAGGSLGAGTTTNILKSLTAQGQSSPQELSQTGNLLGQIAKYTGKSSVDMEKLYKNVERTGMNSNEGLSKTLSLLQSGMSVAQAEKILQSTSQRSEAFSGGQSSYFGASPFHQYMSQQMGKLTGVNPENFFKGDEKEISKARNIFKKSRETLSKGGFNEDVIKAEMLTREGITSAMTEKNMDIPKGKENQGFIRMGAAQEKVIATQNRAIVEGAKGRGPETIVNEALSEIGKSTQTFSILQTATNSVSEGFHELKHTISDMVDSVGKMFHFGGHTNTARPTGKPLTTMPGGR